jgi:heme exporter protein D
MSEEVDRLTRERLLTVSAEIQSLWPPEERSFPKRLWLASADYARYVLGFVTLSLICMSLDVGGRGTAVWRAFTAVSVVVLFAIELYRIRQNHLLRDILENISKHVADDRRIANLPRPSNKPQTLKQP